MEQRDIIKEQIEALGRVLGKIISGFLGLKSQGKVAQGFEIANQQFKRELDIDIDKLLALDKPNLADYINAKNMTADHIAAIADYVMDLGEHQSDTVAKTSAFSSALDLFGIANEKSDTFDLQRQFKEKSILQKLKDLK